MAGSSRLYDDRGDVVLGWLTKLMVAFAVVGLAVIDGVSVVKAHYGATGDADVAASRASAAYALRHDKSEAYAAALDYAIGNDEAIAKGEFHVNAKTGAVALTLTRTADTVVLSRLPPLRKFGVASGSGTAVAPAAATLGP